MPFRQRRKEAKNAASTTPPASAPATDPGSNAAAQDALKASPPAMTDAMYLEAAKNAPPHVSTQDPRFALPANNGPAKPTEDPRYAVPEGYEHSKGEKAKKQTRPQTADEMRAEDKKAKTKPGVYTEATSPGGTAAGWAQSQYMVLRMGPVARELEIWGAAYEPWAAVAGNAAASDADKKKLPTLAKEAIQHGEMALRKIDEGLKILDTRHAAVLSDPLVKKVRDQVLGARTGVQVVLERVKRGGGPDPRGPDAVDRDLANPVDPAMQKGGWAPGAPK